MKSKTQLIRAADVVFIGPVMMAGGAVAAKCKRPILGVILAALGALTIGYNAQNYMLNRKKP